MNAFPSPAHHTGAGDPAPDPSMEEILASIRRIIADDQASVPPASPSQFSPSKSGHPQSVSASVGSAPASSARASAPTQSAPQYAPQYAPPPQQTRQEPARFEPPRQEPPRQEPARFEPPRHEQPRHEQVRQELPVYAPPVYAPPASVPPAYEPQRREQAQPFTIEAQAVNPAPRAEQQRAYGEQAPQHYAAQQAPVSPTHYAAQPSPLASPPVTPQYTPQPAPQYTPAPEVQPVHESPASAAFSAPVVANNVAGDPVLLSSQADASVASAFEALSRSMMLQNSPFMEETVRDLLRPMLKQWLDDNLPPLVERLVRSEIERVARGGR